MFSITYCCLPDPYINFLTCCVDKRLSKCSPAWDCKLGLLQLLQGRSGVGFSTEACPWLSALQQEQGLQTCTYFRKRLD